jgi:predicted dehydrogenase
VKRVRIAVIGVGHMGRFHAEKVASLAQRDGGVVLAAVSDRHPERSQAVASTLGGCAVATAAEAFALADAAILAVPTEAHAALAAQALEAGLDILVEKPIAATLAEAEGMVARAHTCGRLLRVGHLEWHNAALRAVAPRVQRPRFFEAHRLGPFPARSTDIDVVRDLMIHDVDIVQRLVGSEPVRVEAVGVSVVSEHVDVANARLVFADGCVANLTASRVASRPRRRLRIFQLDAYFSIDYQEQSAVVARRVAREERGAARLSHEPLAVERGDALASQLADFVASVRERGSVASPDPGLAALRSALRVVEAMPALAARP